jgi:hypothetical protein
MEIPFLKNKSKNMGGGSIEVQRPSDKSNTQTLLEHIADELIEAINKKDIKSFREALKALVLTITEDQDE